MNAGKAKYDAIEIPAGLEDAIDSGIKRAGRQRPMRALRRTAAGAAAAVCVLFAGANIMPVYRFAADLPVLGSIVRVLHVGSGGEVTDGAQAGAEADGGTVELTFTGANGALDSAPHYTVEHLLAPNRIVLTLHGVRGADFESIRDSLLGAEAVEDVYRNMYLDDSAISLTVVLRDGYGYEVSEHENPGTIEFTFTAGAGDNEGTVYYLRTEAMGYSEQLGLLCEQYHNENASQVKTAGGNYIVTIGQYATEAEAEAALEALTAEYGNDGGFYVASGSAGEIPEA